MSDLMVTDMRDLINDMEKNLGILRHADKYSSGYISTARKNMLMLLNKLSYKIDCVHAMFRRDPEAFNDNDGYRYSFRPSNFLKLYGMAKEFTRRHATSATRFDLGLMSDRLMAFQKDYADWWHKRAQRKGRQKINEQLKRELKKPLFRGLRYELGGKKIAYISAMDEHESDEAFLKECLGPDWENVLTMFTVQLFYFRANKVLEPTVVSNIMWEEVL